MLIVLLHIYAAPSFQKSISDCKIENVRANFNIIRNVIESCSHISKCDHKMLKFAGIIRNVTAPFNILQSDFEICNHVTATFKT